MNRRRESLLLLALAALSLLTNHGVAALTQKYCSNENTGSSLADKSIYQSNGRCTTNCSSYAFAVVQDQDCWCSNYIPSNQESISSCNEACPGYPYEYCGNASSNLYGYVAVGSNAASGTAGSASSSSETTAGSSTSTQATSAAPSSSSSPAATSIVVSSQTATVVSSQTVVNSVIVETTVTADASSSSSATPSTFSTSTAKGTTPVVTTIISSGNIVIITTAATATTAATVPTAAPMETSKSSGGISKGAVAGIVVAAFAGLAIVAFGLLFYLRRRRKDEHIVDSTGMITTPSRMDSQMSRSGLLGNPFRPNSMVHTQNGSSDGGVSPIAPISERRSSKPLVFDQRLNPDLYLHEDSSRVSINTLDDHRDYNRKLNITNPDPVDRDHT